MSDHETVRGKIQRSDAVLMAMATCRRGTLFEPVRIQKLLFLIDREIPEAVDGPHFRFRPYRYGPFDPAVFRELDSLGRSGHVAVATGANHRAWSLTRSGLERGTASLARLQVEVRDYLRELARWVLALSFGRLLAAVYHRYPETATESVALDVVRRFPIHAARVPQRPVLDGLAGVFDLSGLLTERPQQPTRIRSVSEALYDDWAAVGDELRAVMADFATGHDGS